VERTQIYPTLAAAFAKSGFDSLTIEKYGQLWDSINAADRLPCASRTGASDLCSSRSP
jgi:hypothetical protein